METNKTLVKALGGLLVSGMLLSGGIVFAAQAPGPNEGNYGNTPTINSQTVHGKGYHKAGRCKAFQANLDQLVKDGVITQGKADQIKAFTDKKRQEKQARFEQWKKLSPEERKALKEKWKKEKAGRGHGGLFSELVKNNIITQQEADAIKAKMKAKVSPQQQQHQ